MDRHGAQRGNWFPKEPSDEKVGIHGSCIVKLVGHVGTLSVFSVAEEVDGSVTDDTRSNPPKPQCLHVIKSIAVGYEDGNVDSQLEKREELPTELENSSRMGLFMLQPIPV